MNSISGFTKAALAVAVALALGSTGALAATAPSSTQLPGKGSIVSGHVDAGGIVSGQQTITIGNAGDQAPANAVINWGSGSAINAGGVGGFNIGSNAALTFVDGTGNASGAAVLNVDTSGNPSQIFGKLTGTGTSVFVANSNGIVVGSTARISSTAGVGLIANNTLAGTGSDFSGGASIAYNGSGGDVSVAKGASINGASVLIAGGGTVNVSLGALKGPTGSASLSAGVASANAGTGAASNTNASLVTSSALASGVSLGGFSSAGTASNSGTLVLANYNVGGLFTNTGNLTLPATNGAVYNKGTLTTKVAAGFSSLTNDGTYVHKGVTVTRGDLVNNGVLNGANVAAMDGNIINTGSLVGVYNLYTGSDAKRVSGADYSITNTGTITSYGALSIDANDRVARIGNNNTTGSFNSTGTIRVAAAANLTIRARNDLSVGGLLQTGSGVNAKDVSITNPIGMLVLSASGYNATLDVPTFWTNGALSVLTPVAASGAILHGNQVNLMSSVSSVTLAKPNGTITVVAGNAPANGYAVTVGSGATISAKTVTITGPRYRTTPTDGRIVRPNVLLDGVISASVVNLGAAAQPLTDLYSGANGGIIATGSAPSVVIATRGHVGVDPTLSAGNFRYNYLPISAPSGTVSLSMQPIGYKTNGTADGSASVNLLVNGNVKLIPGSYSSWLPIYGNGWAGSPTSTPNTNFVLQSTGNIATSDKFYWPGYLYLGTIARNADGSPAPGTLGSGTISLGGNLSNTLPGSTGSDGGIEFITANPLNMGSYTVTTNANSLISFGTSALTEQYASGALGSGQFYGGKQGSGTAVNYGRLDPSMFSTDAPVATR